MRTPDCVLDGEVCALDEHGPRELLGDAAGQAGRRSSTYVFDVLEIDGEPLVDLPLTERRERLEELLDRATATVRLSEAFEDGEALLAAAEEQRLEGDRRQAGRLALPSPASAAATG